LNGTPGLYLESKARKIGNVRLTGNFGGQVLTNLRDLKPNAPNIELLNKDFVKNIDDAAKCLRNISEGHPLTFFLFKQAPWYDYSRFSLEQSQLVQRSPFMDNDLIKLLYQAPPGVINSREITIRLILEGNPALKTIPTDRGILGGGNLFISNGLHLYREILFKLEYYFSHGMPQWLARINNIIRPLNLENLFLERHKYYNMRRWFRDELSPYVRNILLDNRTLCRPFINKKFLQDMVNGHTSGRSNYTSLINRMLTVELTFRLFVDDPAPM
jgi:asparagine synthase (glutamine-hydrolysing)